MSTLCEREPTKRTTIRLVSQTKYVLPLVALRRAMGRRFGRPTISDRDGVSENLRS